MPFYTYSVTGTVTVEAVDEATALSKIDDAIWDGGFNFEECDLVDVEDDDEEDDV